MSWTGRRLAAAAKQCGLSNTTGVHLTLCKTDASRYWYHTCADTKLPDRNANNLGAIQDSLKGQPNEADIKAMQEVPNRGTVFEGIYIDGPAIFGSSVLLVVLLLLMFNQVFGLDKLIGAAKAKRAEAKADKEKWSIYNARQQLERSMSSFDDSDERQS